MNTKLIQLLKNFGIKYYTEGKNVSSGQAVSVRCPFCDDSSNHLGIFYDSLIFHCWRCGRKGHVSIYLAKELNISKEEALGLLDVQDEDNIISIIKNTFKKSKKQEKKKVSIELPPFFEEIQQETSFSLLEKYLKRRRISKETLIKYKCGICEVGPFMYRLIIPVFFNEEIVGFQAADLTGKAKIKYLNSPNIKKYLYCYDDVDEKIIIVEGVLDCWRIGKDCIATFGITMTQEQRNLILKKKPKTLIFCFDGDVISKNLQEAAKFKPFIPDVRVALLPDDKDPDDLDQEIILEYIDNAINAF